jgi:predicted AlkP superfamily phosphohydrolase/phosphomutase
MKMLVIGLDGGDRRIIRAMRMPNLHKMLEQNVCLVVQEDLWSRGWAEILSGVHGRESGAFYAKPKLHGTHDTTARFSVSDYIVNPDIKPLWSMLCERGHSVGFMNVPSMMPAPAVNGFVVSGGGAGAATSGAATIPLEACCPTEVRERLEQNGYVLDTRFVSSGLRDVDAFLERLIQMTRLRTEAFVNLQAQFHVEFGFLAYMSICRVQYLAMSEIEGLIQRDCSPANAFQKKLLHFYEQFDQQIGSLVARLSPEHVMLVSDHGQSPRLYSINVNDWLVQAGMQRKSGQSISWMKKRVSAVAGHLPQGLKSRISQTAPGLKAKVGGGVNADWGRTSAFGVRYVPGIYINDQKRFAGPVKTKAEEASVVREIIDEFNKDEQAKRNGLSARVYRSQCRHSRYQALLPDIWIDHPDAYFFEQHGSFLEPNKDYGPIKNLGDVDRDMYTGIKGRRPLLCVDPQIADLADENDVRDLTLAYKLICRGMRL